MRIHTSGLRYCLASKHRILGFIESRKNMSLLYYTYQMQAVAEPWNEIKQRGDRNEMFFVFVIWNCTYSRFSKMNKLKKRAKTKKRFLLHVICRQLKWLIKNKTKYTL